MARPDPHSYFDDRQPRARQVRLSWEVDFDARCLRGEAILEFGAEASGVVDLDTKGLALGEVLAGGRPLAWDLAPEEPILGQRLRLDLPAGTPEVRIRYATAPDAAALQWLTPAQTEGKRQPFLFSHCQPIHARTLLPVQDTPAARVTYRAEITVPEPLTAVMSAGPTGVVPGPRPGTRSFRFDMPQPIPPYLMALAVGDLESRELSPRSRVWAEPATVEAAAWEFAGIEAMIRTAEALFGPYEWDRFDMLVLPPSFPYGGMENPRMTFLTPTLLAGDRSLVDVVSHELAHSWTGNLVTNASMDHFWLNEGFTVWADRRIQEALHGVDKAALDWAIAGNGLTLALERFGADSPLTRLRTDLAGLDPDDAYSLVPYEKGARFLALLERTVGRECWDLFVRDYIARFRFTSITTEDFLAFLEEKLPGAAAAVNAPRWLHEPGLPDNTPRFPCATIERIAGLASGWASGVRPWPEQAAAWSPAELLLYLQRLPRELDAASCAWLDLRFGLDGRGNHEILVEWLTIAAGSDYEPAFPRLRAVLTRVGRMKYLRPLYLALGHHPRTRALAHSIFAEAQEGYHALSRRVAESLIEKYPADAP
jgi:aminopeptidase N